LFQRGRIHDIERKKRFLAKLRPKIWKLCVVRTFVDIEKLMRAATELERMLGELRETPYEPFREEQEDGASKMMMEK
jgi:hypothetical protein